MTILFLIPCLHNDYSVVITCVATKKYYHNNRKTAATTESFQGTRSKYSTSFGGETLAVMVAVAVLQALYVIVARLN